MEIYYKLLMKIFTSMKINNIDINFIENALNHFSPEDIYDSPDTLITDSYFSLKHLISDEENITQEEVDYFLECLKGKRKHSFEDKIAYLKEIHKG